MEAKTALCTGGGGFLGRHVVESLLEEGLNVRIFDVSPNLKLRDVGEQANVGIVRSFVRLRREDTNGWDADEDEKTINDVSEQEEIGGLLDVALRDGRATYVCGDLRDKAQVLEGESSAAG